MFMRLVACDAMLCLLFGSLNAHAGSSANVSSFS